MILLAIDSPNSKIDFERNGNVVLVKQIVEAGITVRVVLKASGSLHTAYREDVSMLRLETEAERERRR